VSDDSKPVAVASIRDALRTLVSTQEVADLLNETLVEGLKATKPRSVPCPSCGTSVKVELADLGTRVTAATKLLESIEGRLKEAAGDQADQESRKGKDLLRNMAAMSNEDIAQAIVRLERELSVGAGVRAGD
jgi:hypothetical protein